MSSSAVQVRGLLVAGPASGVGKTTLTLGLLAAWRRRGLRVQPFKVGPDFIDPGHHARAAGRPSYTLDGWMLLREENLRIFVRNVAAAHLAVVEGVMGLFDGFDGRSEAGSSAQMAKWLGLPVLLVVDARALARSAAALVAGFAGFDPDLNLVGVVFNRVGGETHLTYLREAMELLPRIPCFGGLPREAELAIPERHLGLTTADDHPLCQDFLTSLADLVERHLDLDGLFAALPVLTMAAVPPLSAGPPKVRLAVARDRAFCFYYPDNLEWLAHFGAELVEFSPLSDPRLPEDVHGLYLGGGYPELAARELAANESLKQDLRRRACHGLPIYAECGGLMYLSEEIQDQEGDRHAMAGLLPLRMRMLPRLKALGYREVQLTGDTLLGPAGTTLRGHEFHYSEIAVETGPVRKVYRLTPRRSGPSQAEGFTVGNILASYVHLHFGSNPEAARALVAACLEFKKRGREPVVMAGNPEPLALPARSPFPSGARLGEGQAAREPGSPHPLLHNHAPGGPMEAWRLLPQEIEQESFRRIDREAGRHSFAPPAWSVVRRMIHTSADFDYLTATRMHPKALAAGVAALRQGRPVATDTRMLAAGISTGRLARLGVEVRCFMDDPEVAAEAARRGVTRAAVAMERTLPGLAGGIVAIGNAPTALLRLLELLAQGAPPPALIVGLPVGFVNAAESKEALSFTDYPYITALGRKGGSAVAASVVNALAILALEEGAP